MSYERPATPGESVLFYGGLHLDSYDSDVEPFAICVTDRAVYIPRKRVFAADGDPYYFERWPRESVIAWRVGPARRVAIRGGIGIAAVGAVFAWLPALQTTDVNHDLVGWCAIAAGVGAALFAAPHCVTIRTAAGRFEWSGPLFASLFGQFGQHRLARMFSEIRAALQRGGYGGADSG